MQKIPNRLPTNSMDRSLATFDHAVATMIQLELEFDGRLDGDRLARAAELTLDAEPVLGCRFVPRWWRPYWQRLPKAERSSFYRLETAAAYEDFRNRVTDEKKGPLLHVGWWPAPDGDRLLLKVSHVAGDAGAVKEVGEVLASIYRKLGADPGFLPTPNLTGSRSIRQILKHIPWHAYFKIHADYFRLVYRNTHPPLTHNVPVEPGPREPTAHAHRDIGAERMAALKEWGRTHEALINDLLIAAFFRAQVSLHTPEPGAQLRLFMSADMRRYLPGERGEGICNISGLEYPHLDEDLGDTFDDTLRRIVAFTSRRKQNWIGMSLVMGGLPASKTLPYAWYRRLVGFLFATAINKRNHTPVLTNMGPIKPDWLTFDSPPRMARLLPPIVYPPMFGCGLSGYDGTLTLSIGFCPLSLSVERAEAFLDQVLAELPV